MGDPSTSESARRPPAESYFVAGAISQYIGAAVAVNLFDELPPATVALLRVASAATVVLVVRRPWRRRWSVTDLGLAAGFGVFLAAMNTSIYYAWDELPLGNAVAIEFMGPIAVAAVSGRSLRSLLSLAVAAAGVVTLAGVEAEGTLRGVAFALLAGGCWAGYIVLGHRVASAGSNVDGLGVGMAVGTLAIAPLGVEGLGTAVSSPWLLGLAVSTGILSNVIPYGLDQTVMRRISRTRFAFLQALLPVTATVVGLIALAQTPSARELMGISLVVVAIIARRNSD